MGSLHDAITCHYTEILSIWTAAVQPRSAPRSPEKRELAATMPGLLVALGGHDGPGELYFSEEQRGTVARHLTCRRRHGFELDDILSELSALGRCLLRCMRRREGVLATFDLEEVFADLVLATAEVTKVFDEQKRDDERALERAVRLLQGMTSDGARLHEEGEALHQGLRQPLDLVRQAMSADAVAWLLLDSKARRVVVSAATGEAEDALEDYLRSSAVAIFAGQPRSSDGEALAVGDVETSEVEATASLRRGGIQSLLAMRLVARHSLVGVLYLGVRERRGFSAGEAQRLERLGDVLKAHFEQAHVHAALRAKLEEARRSSERSEQLGSALLAAIEVPLAAATRDARRLLDVSPAAQTVPVANIVCNLDLIQGTIADLVDARRIRAGGRLALVLADCELTDIARAVVDEQRLLHGDRFVVRADGPVRGVWDAAQVARALGHLVANAVEHGDGGAPIFVLVRGGNAGVEVAVHNAGAAIGFEAQAQLFAPFARPRSPGSGSAHHGWGLGLTLVWGCAEAHGGRVRVQSTAGRGTTFVLSLPHDGRPYADG